MICLNVSKNLILLAFTFENSNSWWNVTWNYIVIDVMVIRYHFYPCDFKLPGRNALISALHFCLLIWINDNSITSIERSGKNAIAFSGWRRYRQLHFCFLFLCKKYYIVVGSHKESICIWIEIPDSTRDVLETKIDYLIVHVSCYIAGDQIC